MRTTNRTNKTNGKMMQTATDNAFIYIKINKKLFAKMIFNIITIISVLAFITCMFLFSGMIQSMTINPVYLTIAIICVIWIFISSFVYYHHYE